MNERKEFHQEPEDLKRPEDDPIIDYKIDTSSHAGGSADKIKIWDTFAKRHLTEMRILRRSGVLGKKNENWRNVSEHVLVVAAFSKFLADKIKTEDIDRKEIISAAILHDAAKRIDVEAGVGYDREREEGAFKKILKKEGYSDEFIELCDWGGRTPEIFYSEEDQDADIAARPVAQLILAYADTRTRNTDVVTLEEARDKNKEKVPKDVDFYDQWYAFYKKVESRIFEKIEGIKPEDINNKNVTLNLVEDGQ